MQGQTGVTNAAEALKNSTEEGRDVVAKTVALSDSRTEKTIDLKPAGSLTGNSKTDRRSDYNLNSRQSVGFTVVKRNGAMVPFRAERIFSAIEAAFRDTHNLTMSSPLSQEFHSATQAVTSAVIQEVEVKAREGACLTVEGIQDLVEVKLMQSGHYDVARNYIVYRDEHKAVREDSPRNLRVLRRDGKSLVRFNPMKIASAMEKAFRATYKVEGVTPENIIEAVNLITNKVVQSASRLNTEGTQLHVELIQDEVEKQLMAGSFYQVAKDFIIYRAERARLRGEQTEAQASEAGETRIEKSAVVIESGTAKREVVGKGAAAQGQTFKMKNLDGTDGIISETQVRQRIAYAARGDEKHVDVEKLVAEALTNFYEGIRQDEIDQSNIMAARAHVEKEPAYSFVAGRLLLDVIYRETFNTEAHNPRLEELHRTYFKQCLKVGVEHEHMDKALLDFDLDKIAAALKLERDRKFSFLGIQTLYDRYLIHHEERRLETPQIFWMRVAMGLSMKEGVHKEDRAIEFYNVLSQFLCTSSTPTLFNSGTLHPQMSSCYLTTVMDDLKHIFKCVSDDAQLSKWAGGLGNDWTNVRATGARIKGTNGKSQGVIPFLKVANDTAVAVNQGGKRKGAMCAYLETWHLDVEDFLELRKNTGDERRRTHDMNTANWIPDLFMKRVAHNGSWTMFSPSDVPDLHDLVGKAFEKRYHEYEAMADRGEMKLFKRIEAVTLWRKMLSMIFETGHPWITFKDPSNLRSPQDHVGVVHSSNLCTEILLNTSSEETAVCNLASINLVAHVTSKGLNNELLSSTVRTAVRMLDNVIDINFYPTIEAQNANLRHRPVGLGLMGFQDALYAQNISYASQEAVDFADHSMEAISYYAILASAELAKERGAYSSYKGSKWDRGLLPVDTLKLLADERGGDLDVDMSVSMDWSKVRDAVKKYGMRNSNTMAIAPTATISNITGVTQSIEPSYKNLYAKSNLSGEFTVNNWYLVDALRSRGLWDDQMIDDLKYFDGSISEIERIPDEVKHVFLTAFEIDCEWIIECASRRQKWIDMGQSLNLYCFEPNGKKLSDMYLLAWRKGLKTTYYLRSLGATQIEKSTTDINKRGLQPRWMKNKSASSNIIIDREVRGATSVAAVQTTTTETTDAAAKLKVPVCSMEEGCESCQ